MRESGRYTTNCNGRDSVKCNIINAIRQLKRKRLVLLWKAGGMSWRTECLMEILEQSVKVPQAKNGITIFI